jgi:hypothetical protein
MPPADRALRHPGQGTDAASKGRPIPGNVFDDRMQQGPGCNRCLTVCADGFRVLPRPCTLRRGPDVRFSKASRNLSVRCGFCKTQAWTEAAASRQPLPPSPTTRREDHVILIVPMSSDRLFLGGLLASIARLRFTGTINLTCSFPELLQTGHFYFAGNRTFLLCLDSSRFCAAIHRGD